MLAFASIISDCVGTKDPQTGPLAKFRGLQPSFGAFGPVLGPLALEKGAGHTDKQTDKYTNIL